MGIAKGEVSFLSLVSGLSELLEDLDNNALDKNALDNNALDDDALDDDNKLDNNALMTMLSVLLSMMMGLVCCKQMQYLLIVVFCHCYCHCLLFLNMIL